MSIAGAESADRLLGLKSCRLPSRRWGRRRRSRDVGSSESSNQSRSCRAGPNLKLCQVSGGFGGREEGEEFGAVGEEMKHGSRWAVMPVPGACGALLRRQPQPAVIGPQCSIAAATTTMQRWRPLPRRARCTQRHTIAHNQAKKS